MLQLPLLVTLCCAGPSSSSGPKKKRVIKLTRKQKIRKEKKINMGITLNDRHGKKIVKDQRRLDQRLAAKALW